MIGKRNRPHAIRAAVSGGIGIVISSNSRKRDTFEYLCYTREVHVSGEGEEDRRRESQEEIAKVRGDARFAGEKHSPVLSIGSDYMSLIRHIAREIRRDAFTDN